MSWPVADLSYPDTEARIGRSLRPLAEIVEFVAADGELQSAKLLRGQPDYGSRLLVAPDSHESIFKSDFSTFATGAERRAAPFDMP